MPIFNDDNIKNGKKIIGRAPIIPLPIDNIKAATDGELIVDFDSKKIMGKRPGSEEIVDFSGDAQEVDKYSGIRVGFSAGNKPLPYRYHFDNRSISDDNKLIRLLNFEKAGTDYIPFKDGSGYLSWGYIFDVIKSDMCRNIEEAKIGNNNNIVLRSGGLYKSSNVSGTVNIKLVAGDTEYSKILWKLDTGDDITCIFDSNVTFSDPNLIKPNSSINLSITTWNNGNIWYVNSDTSAYSKSDFNNYLSWGYENASGSSLAGIYRMRATRTLQDYLESSKDNNTFYFIEETNQIYRGKIPFTTPYILVDEFPTSNIASEKIYINKNTLEGKVWLDSDWLQIIKPYTDLIDETKKDDDEFLITKKAIIDYLKSKITDEDILNEENKSKLISINSFLDMISSVINVTNNINDNKIPSVGAVKKFISERFGDDDKFIIAINYRDITDGNGAKLIIHYTDDTEDEISIYSSNDIVKGSIDMNSNCLEFIRRDNTKLLINISNLINSIDGGGNINIQDSTSVSVDKNEDVITLSVNVLPGEDNLIHITSDGDGNNGLKVDPILDEGNDDEIILSLNKGVKRSGYHILSEYDPDKIKNGLPTFELVEQELNATIINSNNKIEYDETIVNKTYFKSINFADNFDNLTSPYGFDASIFLSKYGNSNIAVDSLYPIHSSKLVNEDDNIITTNLFNSGDNSNIAYLVYTIDLADYGYFSNDVVSNYGTVTLNTDRTIANVYIEITPISKELTVHSISINGVPEDKKIVNFLDINFTDVVCNVSLDNDPEAITAIDCTAEWYCNYNSLLSLYETIPNDYELHILVTPNIDEYCPFIKTITFDTLQ